MGTPRAPRADAARNRAKLLECARSVFAKRGFDASVSEIAKAAGVGQGTAFRHFPTKDELLCAAMQEHVDAIMEFARAQQERDDAWEGVVNFCTEVVRRYHADRAFIQAAKQGRLGPYAEACHGEFVTIMNSLLDRAKAAGQMRADVGEGDIELMLTAAGDTATPEAGERILSIMLDGMRRVASPVG